MSAVDKSLPDVQQTDLIGCCGFYNRCSAVLHCVADSETASRCIYRKTLESGVSYYGKTAVSFNAKDYNRLLSAYDSLPELERNAFAQLIYAFVYRKRLSRRFLLYSSSVPALLESSGLVLVNRDPYTILQEFSFRYLQEHARKLVPSLKIGTVKEAGIQKLIEKRPDFVSAETNRFVFVSLPESIDLYDELFFHHKIGNLNFSLVFPKNTEPCFYTDARTSEPEESKPSRFHARIGSITAQTTDFDTSHPCYDKTFVFTGTFQHYPDVRSVAQLVCNLGGHCKDAVSSKVDYLVLGNLGYSDYPPDHLSVKMKKAQELQGNGNPIKILSEDEFLLLLSDDK